METLQAKQKHLFCIACYELCKLVMLKTAVRLESTSNCICINKLIEKFTYYNQKQMN